MSVRSKKSLGLQASAGAMAGAMAAPEAVRPRQVDADMGDSASAAALQRLNQAVAEMKTLTIAPGTSVGRLAEMLNSIGTTPRDMIAILQAIKDAGALNAELRIL